MKESWKNSWNNNQKKITRGIAERKEESMKISRKKPLESLRNPIDKKKSKPTPCDSPLMSGNDPPISSPFLHLTKRQDNHTITTLLLF